MLICQSNESVEREIVNTQTLISGRVDGIIVSRTKYTENFDHFIGVQNSHIPMVFFDRTCHGLQTDKVIIDDYKAAFEATEYLIKTGCKKLIHFAGPENLKISAKRMWGFIDALKKNKIPYKESQVIKADNFTEGRYETERIVKSGNLPDGIFTVNDMTAAGVIHTLKRHHINIPGEISVFGFTNGLISTITLKLEVFFFVSSEFIQFVCTKRRSITECIYRFTKIGFSLSVGSNEEYLSVIDRYFLADQISELVSPKLGKTHQAFGCIGIMI